MPEWTAYLRDGTTAGSVAADAKAVALAIARQRWAFVAYVEPAAGRKGKAASAPKPAATPVKDVAAPVAAKRTSKSGKEYYDQPAPEARGYTGLKIRLKDNEAEEFRRDAKPHGGITPYIRLLWRIDREKRGLPPIEPS